MKIKIVEQQGATPLRDGVVLDLVRSDADPPLARTLGWRCIIHVSELDKSLGIARIRQSGTDLTFLCLLPKKRHAPPVKPLKSGDNEFTIDVPWNAFSTVNVEVWQDNARGDRHAESIYLLTRWYRWIAHASLLFAGVVPVVMLGIWRYHDDSIYLGDTPLSTSIVTILSAVGISLGALTGSTVVDVLVRTVGTVATATKGPPSSSFFRHPLLVSLVTVLFGLFVIPLGFKRVCNSTGGKPEIEGYGTPIPARTVSSAERCVLLWSPFSPPSLSAGSSSFKLEPDDTDKLEPDDIDKPRRRELVKHEQGEPGGADRAFSFKGFSSRIQGWSVRCKQVQWGDLRLELEKDDCTPKNDQALSPPAARSQPDGGAPLATLENKPFAGVASWEYDGARLNCTVPVKSTLQLFNVGAPGRAPSSGSRGVAGELLVECRQDRREYDLVSQSIFSQMPPADGSGALPPFPLCIPRNAIDCRLTVNTGKDAILELPTGLLAGRKTSIEGATCSVGYQANEYGPARVARIDIDVEKIGDADVTINAGVCTMQRRDDEKSKELYAMLPEKLTPEWKVPGASVGTKFSFPRGLLDGRKIDLVGNAMPRTTITCPSRANTLAFMEVVNLSAAGPVKVGAGEFAVHKLGADRLAAWLCIDTALFAQDQKQQCNRKNTARTPVTVGGTDVWIDLNARPAVRRCVDVVNYCCYVCKQTRGNPAESKLRQLATCVGANLPGRSVDAATCEKYPPREKFDCP